MSNINNPTQDASTRLFNEFLLAAGFGGVVIWIIWMYFYFHIGIGRSLSLLLEDKNPLLMPFFIMCFFASFFLNAFLFTYFSTNKNKDKHYRGAKRVD